jgi:RNA polymerase sigma-B factor
MTTAEGRDRDTPVTRVTHVGAANHDDDEYEYLAPVLTQYLRLPTNEPARIRLREQLVNGYLPVAHHLARRYSHRGVPLEDLTQIAALGLLQAIDRFDPDYGSSFLAYAIVTMQGEIRRYFRDRTWSMRVPRRLKDLYLSINRASTTLASQLGRAPRPSELAKHLEISTEEVLEGLEAGQAYATASLDQSLEGSDNDADTTIDQLGEDDPDLARVEIHETLEPLLAKLPARERTILVMRFYANMTQSQIADRLGLSQMHVSRILARTLTELRTRMQQG